MNRSLRSSLLALICAAALGAGPSVATAAFMVDTTRLPRISGAKEIYATRAETGFTTRDSIARAFEKATSALIDDDWQPYQDLSAARTSDPELRRMSFKKGSRAMALTVFTSPAQANATAISYAERNLGTDLPFPKDATRIAFDPDRPYLSFLTADDSDAVTAFFRKELSALGWTAHAEAAQTDTPTRGLTAESRKAAAYFASDSRGLMLTWQPRESGALFVELQGIERSRIPSRPVQTTGDATNTQDLLPAQPAHIAAPIPLPPASAAFERDGARGTMNFTNPASAPLIAEYYRATLAAMGWQERPAVDTADKAAFALQFSGDGGDLMLTIRPQGPHSRITAEGSVLARR